MKRFKRSRKLALIVPECLAVRPFECFVSFVGVIGVLPVVLRLDNSNHSYERFPDWLPYLWALLMFMGAVRTIWGLKHNRRIHISAGSLMVSWMLLAYGLATLYNTHWSIGWMTAACGLAMIILSEVRGIHLRALEWELRKVT